MLSTVYDNPENVMELPLKRLYEVLLFTRRFMTWELVDENISEEPVRETADRLSECPPEMPVMPKGNGPRLSDGWPLL